MNVRLFYDPCVFVSAVYAAYISADLNTQASIVKMPTSHINNNMQQSCDLHWSKIKDHQQSSYDSCTQTVFSRS